MKLLRLGQPGWETPAVLAPNNSGVETLWDASDQTADYDSSFFARGGINELQRAFDSGALTEIAAAESTEAINLRRGAPIARPGNLICVGMNYAAHAAESGSAPPSTPVIFLKPANTVTGPDDPVPIPPESSTYDWEVELGVVIGTPLSYATSPAQASAAIAGYVLANDLSEREYQLSGAGGQWTKGKSLPQSTPLGPWLVPAAELRTEALQLRSCVNDELRQSSTTADMIFDLPSLIHHISQYMLLEPGDLILTGTPEAVALSGRFPYLQEGDTITLEISGLGRMSQRCYRATA